MSRVEDTLKKLTEESEETRDAPYSADAEFTRPNRSKSVVQSVRLPADIFAEIESIASIHEVPVSALIRGWVLEAVALEKDATLESALNRLSADVDRVRRLAGEEAA